MISKSPPHLCNWVSVAAAKYEREDWINVKELFPDNNSSSSETLLWLFSLAWARDSPTLGAGPLPVTCQFLGIWEESGDTWTWNTGVLWGLSHQREKTGMGNGNWDGNVDTLLLRKKWRDSRKERGGMASLRSPGPSWPLGIFLHLLLLTITPCLLFLMAPEQSCKHIFRVYLFSPVGMGVKIAHPKPIKLYSWSHHSMDQHLHWFHLDLSHFPMSYTLFPEGQQETFASWKRHLREVLPSS